uniref:Uncharacterized protein n=1 Tax=Nothobranchius furzeri TaxID=105023 RepID=A0A8C6L9R5_NOTFU
MCFYDGFYPEIVGVHVQFLRVQHTQVFVCVLDVIHVLHSSFQTSQDHLSMSGHFGIAFYRLSIVEVSKGTKIPLSPGVDDETPEQSCRTHNIFIDLGEDALDGGALEVCPFDHFCVMYRFLSVDAVSTANRSGTGGNF